MGSYSIAMAACGTLALDAVDWAEHALQGVGESREGGDVLSKALHSTTCGDHVLQWPAMKRISVIYAIGDVSEGAILILVSYQLSGGFYCVQIGAQRLKTHIIGKAQHTFPFF